MNEAMLEVRELRKTYGSLVAVEGISFSVQRGECLGLLGPNGAGKTTTLSMLSGLLTPDSGQVLIEGRALAGDTDPLKNKLGLVPQDLALYDELSARDNLKFFGALYDLSATTLGPRIAEALAIVGLSDRASDHVKTFSGGMKRRLNLAAALLHQPELLLLDEPTVGVDPQSRNAIFGNIETLRAQGKTIIYTTHYMEEVERLCNHVVIMDHGKIIVDDTLAGLKQRAGQANLLKIALAGASSSAFLPALRALPGVRSVNLAGAELSIELDDLVSVTPPVLLLLKTYGQNIAHLSAQPPTLESIFLTYTGRQLRDP